MRLFDDSLVIEKGAARADAYLGPMPTPTSEAGEKKEVSNATLEGRVIRLARGSKGAARADAYLGPMPHHAGEKKEVSKAALEWRVLREARVHACVLVGSHHAEGKLCDRLTPR